MVEGVKRQMHPFLRIDRRSALAVYRPSTAAEVTCFDWRNDNPGALAQAIKNHHLDRTRSPKVARNDCPEWLVNMHAPGGRPSRAQHLYAGPLRRRTTEAGAERHERLRLHFLIASMLLSPSMVAKFMELQP
jgi:hypothetical protein